MGFATARIHRRNRVVRSFTSSGNAPMPAPGGALPLPRSAAHEQTKYRAHTDGPAVVKLQGPATQIFRSGLHRRGGLAPGWRSRQGDRFGARRLSVFYTARMPSCGVQLSEWADTLQPKSRNVSRMAYGPVAWWAGASYRRVPGASRGPLYHTARLRHLRNSGSIGTPSFLIHGPCPIPGGHRPRCGAPAIARRSPAGTTHACAATHATANPTSSLNVVYSRAPPHYAHSATRTAPLPRARRPHS